MFGLDECVPKTQTSLHTNKLRSALTPRESGQLLRNKLEGLTSLGAIWAL